MFVPTVLIIFSALVALGTYVFFAEPLWLLPMLQWATPGMVYRVSTRQPLVALSFDDGPHPVFTPQVLEILGKHNARATFFLIGERALKHPELVTRIRAAGHEIGNHYFRNVPTLMHSDGTFVRYLEETERALGGGKGLELFRPPGGVAWPRQLKLAREHGYTCVLGCAYPHDPMRPPVSYIRWLVKKNLAPGTIVILHDGIADAGPGIEALPEILEEGRLRGLQFVSIGETMKGAAD
jgi:peptidoglycan/xylan/chitin deacetylase (PgdA/CDA1 family)